MREQKNEGRLAMWRRWRRPVMFALAWAGVAGACFCWGRYGNLPNAKAEPAGQVAVQDTPRERPPSDYSRRPVAWIFGNIPITREELGEYLILRTGKDRLKNLINKRIIDHVAKARGIDVTMAEMDASMQGDAASLGVSKAEFRDQILKRYGKSEYEWKEDVIRPRLIMEKMCRSRVAVTREDLTQAFEAKYGEKVDCKIIMWPMSEKKNVINQIWPQIHNSEAQFDHYARLQASPSLAAVGGHIKPIGRHTTGDEKLEQVAFRLQKDEVSEVMETTEGLVVVKCLGRVPADTSASFEQRRGELEKEVFDRKVTLEIGKMFQELQAQAKPQNLLEPTVNVVETTEKMLKGTPGPNPIAGSSPPPPPTVPNPTTTGVQGKAPPAGTPPTPPVAAPTPPK